MLTQPMGLLPQAWLNPKGRVTNLLFREGWSLFGAAFDWFSALFVCQDPAHIYPRCGAVSAGHLSEVAPTKVLGIICFVS
jgi:hypothetical protein